MKTSPGMSRTLSLEEALEQAAAHHRAGALAEAEGLYRAILQAQPTHPDANHNLGVVEMQKQRFAAALPYLKAALAENPGYGQYWLTYIEALLLAGDGAAAAQVLAEGRPRGLQGAEVDALAARIDACSRSRFPDSSLQAEADRHCRRAEELKKRGQSESAIAEFLKVIELAPEWSKPHAFLGIIFNELGRLDEAEASFRRVLEIEPDQADGHYNLGIVLHRQKRLPQAEACFWQAIRLRSDHVEARNNLGIVLHDQGRFSASEESFRSALAIFPGHAEALNNLGVTLNEMDRVDEARQCFEKAISVRSDYAEAWNNCGNALEYLGDFEQALAHYEQAVRLQPAYLDANWNKALSGLRFGRYAESWPIYELRLQRWENPTVVQLEKSSVPRWRGDRADMALEGRRILLHAEQGLGDTLQFCRYALLVAARGAKVFLQAQDSLVELLRSLGNGIEVLAEGEPLPAVDFHCPLMSLPLEFATTLANIPNNVPYLKCSEDKAAWWAARLGKTEKLRVGLVWSSGFRPNRPELWRANARRNIPLQQLASLRELPGIEYISLQKGQEGEAQLHELRRSGWRGPEIRDFAEELNDFSDTAALIDNLDLVLSVDTSTAHLAGALGKPVWLIARYDACWRWLLGRNDSPWYPTLTLFRQVRPNEWEAVVEAIAQGLAGLSSAHPVSAHSVQKKAGALVALPAAEPSRAAASPLSVEVAKDLQRAVGLHLSGKLQEARQAYRALLPSSPDSADILRLLGTVETQLGAASEGVTLLERALQMGPDHPETHNNLGNALLALGRTNEALVHYSEAVRLRPIYAEAHVNRADALKMLGRLDEARESYDEAIRLNPAFVAAYVNRGVLLEAMGSFTDAVSSYDQAISHAPDLFEAHCNRGNALLALGRLMEAVASYRQAVRLQPENPDTRLTLGNLLGKSGDIDAGLAEIEQAQRLRPDFMDARWNMAHWLLIRGDYAAGWPAYEIRWARWSSNGTWPVRQFPAPRWHGGQELKGKRILLHAEQGFGDTLQFCRYAPLVAARGARVFLQAQASLVELLRGLNGGIEVFAEGKALPAVDFHCPLMSLPLEFGTMPEHIPATIPYLSADPDKRADWQHRLGKTGRLRVGLAWRSGVHASHPELRKDNARRNIPLAQLEALGRLSGVEFYSLQKDAEAARELHDLQAAGWAGPQIVDLTEEFADFSDTAALIDNLDLVISVDTAVAHLAGAMGKPVWILLRFDACWRWMLGREDSPWYPTARLMRQGAIDDWRQVLVDLPPALEERAARHGVAEAPRRRENDAKRHNRLGLRCWNDGRFSAAAKSFEAALDVDPDDAEAHNNLSLLLVNAGRWREAENGFLHAMRINPDFAKARANLGSALLGMGRLADAEQHLRESLAVCPNSADIMSGLGSALMALGKTAEAEAFLRLAVTHAPQAAFPLANALLHLDYQPDDPCFQHLEAVYASRGDLPVAERIRLDFAMARAMNSVGDYGRAFEACAEGNRLHGSVYPYDENADWQFLEKVKSLYTAELIAQLDSMVTPGAGAGSPDLRVPVFIVGLPDSGGHLIERLLSRHPDVVCVADQRAVDHLVDSVGVLELLLPDASRRESSAQSLRNLGRMYLDRLQMYAGEAKFMVNTLPDHYRHLGLIRLMLPNAKIIHAQRDPLVTCLSCYSTLFSAGHGYSYDLGAMGRHYGFYRQLMSHWHAVLPEEFLLDVCYETHRADPEAQAQRLLSHVGLAFDRASWQRLEDGNAENAQVTASSERPACAASIAQQAGFSRHFDALRKALAPWRGQPDPAQRQELIAAYGRGAYLDAAELARGMTAKQPWHALGWQVLGAALTQLGEMNEAVTTLQRALLLDASPFQAHYNLGVALRNAGRLEEAMAYFQRALEIAPEQVEAHYNLGITLKELERLPEAEQCLRRAVELKPDDAAALNNLGIVLHELGHLEAAEAVFLQALSGHPEHAEAWDNLGLTLTHLGRPGEAAAAFRKSIEQKPDYLPAYANLGALLIRMRRLDEAERCFQQALAFAGEAPAIHCGLGSLHQARGEMKHAATHFRRALALVPDHAAAYSSLLFCLCHDADIDAPALFAAHREFARLFEAPWISRWPKHENRPDAGRTLQIGFVSADLRSHPVADFLAPVLACMDKNNGLNLHAYYNEMHEDGVSHRLKGYFSTWSRVAHLTDAALFDRLRADGIDILIDLSGHTGQNRLACLARKPAPLQASWLGYSGTTGLQAMDYYLASEDFLPHGQFDHLFTEKIIHLPAPVPFSPDPHAVDVSPLPALENGHLSFGSFNRPNKIGRAVVALWSALLRQLPTTRLILVGMNDIEDAQRLLGWFEEENVAAERLEFVERCSLPEYFAYHRRVDICLDAFPFNGSSTTGDALWMGVPTLTLKGETLQSRAGWAWLRHFGREDFVADDPDRFVEMGMAWAQRLPELSRIRAGLRAQILDTPSCRPESIARALEFALRTMWQRWCAGQPPASFAVPPRAWHATMDRARV